MFISNLNILTIPPLGIHRYKNEILKEISKSSMSHIDANMNIKGNINYNYDQAVMEKTNRSLLSYEIVYQQNKNPPSLSWLNNFEELYFRLLSMINQDTNRVYYLMKHARHSCFGLVQIAMNDDQLMDLFKYLNNFLPSIYE
ncbi:unnamed protein product [Rotaria magnacalcarata]